MAVRDRVPRRVRRSVATSVETLGRLTSWARVLPAFVIVGAQRCGTNSLYEYLVSHPRVGRALPGQEVHYFDLNFDRDLGWYRGHFPTRARGWIANAGRSLDIVAGESSPYYLFHPLVAGRIASSLPDVRVLVLLRDPIDRAYSHYNHERSRGYETLSFREALDREPERLHGEEDRLAADPAYRSFNHQHFSYVSRGEYAGQLERLRAALPPDRIHVAFSEDLFADPRSVQAEAMRFLGLEPSPLTRYRRHNTGRYDDLEPKLRRRLAESFGPANERLSRLLGRDLPWAD